MFLRCSIQHNFIGKLSNFDLPICFCHINKLKNLSTLLPSVWRKKRRPKQKHLRKKNCCEPISNTLRGCHPKTHDRSNRLNLKLQGARIWVLLVHPNVGIVEDHLAALKHWKTDGPNQQNHPSNSRKLLYLTHVLPPILNCMALENKNGFVLKFIVRLALFFLRVKNPQKALSKANSTCHSSSSTRPPPQNDMATSDGNRLGHFGFAFCWEKILPPSTCETTSPRVQGFAALERFPSSARRA